jgi:hypothetical protein
MILEAGKSKINGLYVVKAYFLAKLGLELSAS